MVSSFAEEGRNAVREHYGQVAETSGALGCAPGCCGATASASAALGYSSEELAAVPDGANLGLGCGNPQAIADPRAGETVLDLGSGGGFDCFLAARRVGPTGLVVGVDMTPQMITKARESARRSDVTNVDFRLGEIEHLPIQDASVDVILSNCAGRSSRIGCPGQASKSTSPRPRSRPRSPRRGARAAVPRAARLESASSDQRRRALPLIESSKTAFGAT